MRVISGRCKGANLIVPNGNWLRPTSDRVRESIFSTLYENVVGAKVLDLFAGTGSFGIEALSRGAQEVTFVDRSSKAIQCISKNLLKLKLSAQVFRMTEFMFIKKAMLQNFVYDIIFCDPPYDYSEYCSLLTKIVDAQLVRSTGCIIYESRADTAFPEVNSLKVIKEKRMGDTKVTFLQVCKDHE